VTTLDEKTAFEAMRRFLQNYYERGDRLVGDLLGDIGSGLWEDGSTNDPAQWHDWLQAVKETTGE
jgi:hypothetical protein